MTVPFVDLHAQYLSIKGEIDEAIASVISQSAYVGGAGNPFVTDFENSFAKYVGIKHCIGCANGTDSLEIILKAYGIGAGDEVIVPAFTWISTSEAVSNIGAKPVFVDIHPDFYTINIKKIVEKISSRTKAIIPVHLYGLPAEMDEIIAIAKKNKLIVIEDCAQAHGAEYRGKKVGNLGHAASFSFYPGKNLGAYGDAGCVVTNDDVIAERCRIISNHGQMKKHQHKMEGRNSRLDGLQAAVLSVKLKYLERWNDRRRQNADLYKKHFADKKLVIQKVPEYSKHVYHIFSVLMENRDSVLSSLKDKNINAAVHYPSALPFLEVYSQSGFVKNDFPVSFHIAANVISLPMYPELSVDEIDYIVSCLPISFVTHY
jgi:dTDP-4-amino-4,6-dideoxygalactose transaminase